MSTLLPPVVIAPVSVLSTSVRVDGPLPGSTVALLINGVAGADVPAGSTTTTYIPVLSGALNPGDAVTARWSMGGETSAPSPVAVGVLGLPPMLSPLVFLSQVHACVDWIRLGAAYPGATVELFDGGTLVGHAVAKGDRVSVRVTKPVNANDELRAQQRVETPSGTIKSDPTPSLPAEAAPFRENTMPAPFVGPVPGCAQAVSISGIAPGATTELDYNGDLLEYPFVGTNFWALLGRAAHHPDSFSAAQRFVRCSASSPGSTPSVVVDESQPVRKPAISISQVLCRAAGALPLSNLEPGATLTITLVQPTGESSIVGRIGVGEDVSAGQYWIPDLSDRIPGAPPFPSLVVTQEHCGKSASSDKTLVWGTYQGSIFPPTILGTPVECAGGVFVNNVDSAVVRIYSDAADSPVISAPVFSAGGAVWVETVRSLRAGEQVHAELELTCQPAELRVGPPVAVDSLHGLKPPEFQQPIRVFHRYVYFTAGIVPGARVHVFVNDKWRASGTAPDSTVFFSVYVGELHAEDRVTALQALCTKMSPRTQPPINVTPGQMLLGAVPPSLMAGAAQTLTVKAVDADNKVGPVAASVAAGGAVIGATNTPFAVMPPSGATALNLQIAAEGYSTQTLSIPVAPPPVAKPAVLTLTTGLWFNASKKAIKDISWHLLGPASAFDKTEHPNTDPATVQIALPKPAGGGFTSFTLSCEVTFEFEDFEFHPGISGTRASNFIQGGLIKPSPSTMGIQWHGSDMTINFLVTWVQSADVFVINPM